MPGVVEAGGCLCLAQDPTAGWHHPVDRLDGDRALQAPIPRLVDNPEAAAADSALDQEPVEDEGTHHSTSDLRRNAVLSCLAIPQKTHRLRRLWRSDPPPCILSAQSTSFGEPFLEDSPASRPQRRPRPPRRPERQQIVLPARPRPGLGATS